jgi:glycosidase
MARRRDPQSLEGRIFSGLQQLVSLRKQHPVFAGAEMEVIDTGNEHVLGYVRISGGQRALLFANFSEQEQVLPANLLRLYGLSYTFRDLLSGAELSLQDITLSPYQFLCLRT